MHCPACEFVNPDTAKFCSECATKLKSICPNCGTDNPPKAKFCNECATPLTDQTTQPQTNDLEHQFAAFRNSLPSTYRDRLMAPADGENRLVTVLFADMSSSVATTAGLDPGEAAELVNRLLKAMVDAFTRYEGRVDRFLGDGALAVFGAPYTHENDPERAILSAYEIREKARELGLQVTSGINTGRVYFGAMGNDDHRELTVMGPVVNLAARIQGKANAGEILIGETTQRHVRRAFELTRREAEIKGIEGAVPVYRVERQLPRMIKARGLDGVSSELIGRDEELARLLEAYELTAAGEGQLACVVGEAGLGKTRLVAELRRHVAKSQKRPLWLEGHCIELDVSPSYWPVIDMFREYFGLTRQDRAGADAQKIQNGLDALTLRASFSESRLREIGCIIGRLLSVTFGNDWDNVLDGAESETIRNMSFLAIRDVLLALAKDSPVIVVLDDLHWADGVSIDVISLLMESLNTAPILIVCVYRPDRDHRCIRIPAVASRKCPERFVEIGLKELTAGQCRRMIQSLLAVGDLPLELRSMILDKSQGNPLFLEEVIRSLIDSGVIHLDGDEWKASADATEVAVPDSVQGIILSRVDRLDENLKDLLQCASVIGRIFGRRLLETLAKREIGLTESLGQLEDRALIYQESAVPEQQFAFKHVMARDAVYDGILKRNRGELHARVATSIKFLYADELEDHHEQLAYHYERAENRGAAAVHLIHAAERALEQHALRSADEFYERASTFLHDTTTIDNRARAELLRGRGRTRRLRGRLRDGIADLTESYYLFREIGADSEAIRLACDPVCEKGMNDVLNDALHLCDPSSAEAAKISLMILSGDMLKQVPVQRALATAQEQGDFMFEVAALKVFAQIDMGANRFTEGCEKLERALELCRDFNLQYEVPSLMSSIAQSFVKTDRAEYERRMKQAIDAAHELGLGSDEAGMYLSWALWESDLARKTELFELSVRAKPDIVASIWLSDAYRQLGKHEKYADMLREAASILQNQEVLPEQTAYLWFLGRMARNTGDSRIPELLKQALSIHPEPVDSNSLNSVMYHAGQAMNAALSGDREMIEQFTAPIQESIARNSIRQNTDKYIVQVHFYPLAICFEAQGALDQAIEHLEVVLETSEDRDFWILCAEMHLNRGEPGDAARAGELLQNAAAEMDRLDLGDFAEWRDSLLDRIKSAES